MNTVKEFTPVLMYVDHERIDMAMKSAKEFADKINSKFRETEEFLDQKLEDEQLFHLAKKGILYVDELLSERFQFKNATKEFNLEALGLTESYKHLEISLRSSTSWITVYDYTIEEGVVFLSEKGKDAIVKANTHYTQNDAQSEAFKLAERMVKDLNKAVKRDWITSIDFQDVIRGNILVNHNAGKFLPHYRNIKSMNDIGKRMI